jgi:FkbM family methyltransferase
MQGARGVIAGLTPLVLRTASEARALGISRRQLNLVRAWHLQLLPSLEMISHGLVVDIGAHEGHWTRALLEIVPKAQVICVEPQADLCALLERRFAGDGRVSVDGRAVADAPGTRPFHLLGASVNGSLHTPRPGMDEFYDRGWEVRDTVSVETTTVDEIVGARTVGLLKIDVQGAEQEVLAGATAALPRTTAVMLEVTFVSHYEGDATFVELHRTMQDAGFRLAGISSPARSPRGAMLTADACYVNLDFLDPFLREGRG